MEKKELCNTCNSWLILRDGSVSNIHRWGLEMEPICCYVEIDPVRNGGRLVMQLYVNIGDRHFPDFILNN